MQETKARKRLISLLLVLMMVLSILPVGALASANSAAGNVLLVIDSGMPMAERLTQVVNTTIPKETLHAEADVVCPNGPTPLNALVSSYSGEIYATVSGDSVFIDSIGGYPSASNPGYWMYAVNGEIGQVAINQYVISDNDYVSLFFISTAKNDPAFGRFRADENNKIVGAMGSDFEIEAVAGETIYLQGECVYLDFADTRVTAMDTDVYINTSSGVGGYADANGQVSMEIRPDDTNVTSFLPSSAARQLTTAYVPVKVVSAHSVDGNVALNEQIAAYEVLNASDYTAESWAAATTAYNLAKAAKDKPLPEDKFSARNRLERELYDLVPVNEARLDRLALSFGDTKQYLDKAFDPDTYEYSCSADAPASVTITAEPRNEGATVTYLLNGVEQSSNVITGIPTGQVSIITVRVTAGSVTKDYTIKIQRSQTDDPGVYAYLPIGGQYVNEKIGEGSWGEIYDASGNLKNLSGSAPATTGVSLGSFGGYLVYDFGTAGVANAATNPYGIDFILYGNAAWNSSEPGAVQVSQDGETWYDLAGSLYYTDLTDTDAAYTYGNPNPADSALSCPAEGTLASVPWTTDNWATNGLVVKNAYHDHSWFPLYHNYCAEAANPFHRVDMAKMFDLPFVDYSTGQTFTYTGEDGQHTVTGAQTIRVTGACLDISATMGTTSAYLFGYCDVHPIAGENYTTAYNPYAVAEYNDATSFKSLLEESGAAGGDGFDISWAVDSSGAPVALDSIRYVRIYTSVMQMNGVFGEFSTEVCGVYAATGNTTETPDTPTVKVKGIERMTTNGGMTTLNRLGTSACTVDVCGTGYIYINGVATTSASFVPSSEGTKVQIIVQNGEAAPYITWLNLKP